MIDSYYLMEDGWYWMRLDLSGDFNRIVSVCRLEDGDYLINSDFLSYLLHFYPNLQLAPVAPVDATKAFKAPICKGVNL